MTDLADRPAAPPWDPPVVPAPQLVSRRPAAKAFIAFFTMAATAAAITAGLASFASSYPAEAVLMAGMLLGGAVAVYVGLRRFEWLVVAIIFTRSLLDVAGGAQVGPAELVGTMFLGFSIPWLLLNQRANVQINAIQATTVAFAVFALVSSVVATRPAAGVEWMRIMVTLTMILVVDRLVDRDASKAIRILRLVVLSAIIPVIVAIPQAAFGIGTVEIDGFPRIRGTFLFPNPFASYLAIVVIVVAAIQPALDRRFRRITMLVAIVAVVMMLATYTRGAWIACVVGLLVIGVVRTRSILVLLAVAAALVPVMAPSVLDRFSDLGEARQTVNIDAAANSWQWRLDYWSEILDLGDTSPITGVGLTGVAASLPEEKPPHNDYVRLVAETGWVGLAIYLAWLASIIVLAWQVWRRSDETAAKSTALAALATFLAIVVLASVANLVSQAVVMMYTGVIAGALSGLAHRTRVTDEDAAEPGADCGTNDDGPHAGSARSDGAIAGGTAAVTP